MLKILTTQLTGVFNRIGKQEETVEETARILAQATVGQGTVFFAAFDEFKAVSANALHGAEPFKGAKEWTEDCTVTGADRVWILARSTEHEEALALARSLDNQMIPFALLAGFGEDSELTDLSYSTITIGISKGLVPDDNGVRKVMPHALAALYVYEAVKSEYDEMLSDV